MFALVTFAVVLVLMLGEARLSASNERWLRQRGAVEPPLDVYRTMRWAYPAAFAAMAAEGAASGTPSPIWILGGGVIFTAAKLLKYWAIASLGRRWTFRVLVLPGAPLVRTGPYAVLRHPNYVAVLGELSGMALLVGARFSGPVAFVLFALLLRRRIEIEERTLAAVR